LQKSYSPNPKIYILGEFYPVMGTTVDLHLPIDLLKKARFFDIFHPLGIAVSPFWSDDEIARL